MASLATVFFSSEELLLWVSAAALQKIKNQKVTTRTNMAEAPFWETKGSSSTVVAGFGDAAVPVVAPVAD